MQLTKVVRISFGFCFVLILFNSKTFMQDIAEVQNHPIEIFSDPNAKAGQR